MKDYQGNNRVVMDQNSSFEQITHYYPFGGLFGQGMGTAVQQYKYGGKYLERMHRLDLRVFSLISIMVRSWIERMGWIGMILVQGIMIRQ